MASNAAKGSSIREPWDVRKGPGYGHALFHPSGEFMDTSMCKVVQAYLISGFPKLFEAFCGNSGKSETDPLCSTFNQGNRAKL